MTARCPKCGRFIKDECSLCYGAVLNVATSVLNLALLTTLIQDPRTPQIMEGLRKIWGRSVRSASWSA